MTNGSMTKAELVEEVSRVSDLTKKHSEVIVDTEHHRVHRVSDVQDLRRMLDALAP